MPKIIKTTKTCRICKQEKKIDEFIVYQRKCKICMSELQKTYYNKNIKQKHPKPVGRPNGSLKLNKLLMIRKIIK